MQPTEWIDWSRNCIAVVSLWFSRAKVELMIICRVSFDQKVLPRVANMSDRLGIETNLLIL